MSIYSKPIASYEHLPKWGCGLCKLEMDCVGKGFNVLSPASARKRFKMKHDREKPKCPGRLKYHPGIKKVEGS